MAESLHLLQLLLALAGDPALPPPPTPGSADTLPPPAEPDRPVEPVAGAETRRGRYRVGVTLGGTNLAGLTFEVRSGNWAAEATLGTVTFRDFSLALTGKRYFSGRTFRPYAGLGVWALGAATDEGRGGAFIVRLPAGVDWKFVRQHSIGAELALNRALWVKRMDPEDDTPPRDALIPIPSLYYRFGWDQ